jgi:hypothetical protein
MLQTSPAKLIAIISSLALLPFSAFANENSSTFAPAINKAMAAINKTTLGSTLSSSDIDYRATNKIPELPSFTLKKGTPLSELPAGFLKLAGKSYSPLSAGTDASVSADDVKKGRLGNLKFLEEMPLKEFSAANPQLKNIKVSTIPGWSSGSSKTIGDLAADPIAGTAPIPADVLQSAKIGDFPGVVDTPYSAYKGVNSMPISKLFAVENISLDKVLSAETGSIPSGLQVMKFDRLATKETNIGFHVRDNVSSGTNKKPNNPCPGEKTCAYGELRSTVLTGKNPLNGTKTIIDQESPGGEGWLGEAMTNAGILEKDGYAVPYISSCGAKWSLTQPDPIKGTVQQQLHLRICYDTPVGRQATPYFIGGIPIGSASEKEATVFIPMDVKPKIDTKVVQVIEPPKKQINGESLAGASQSKSTAKEIQSKISTSSLSLNQQNSVLAESLALLKDNPLMSRNAIIAEAARRSFAGASVKSNPENPALPIGGSPDAITTAILS